MGEERTRTHLNCKLFASALSSSAITTCELVSHLADVSCSRAFSRSSTRGFALAPSFEGDAVSGSPAMIAWRSDVGGPAKGDDGDENEDGDRGGGCWPRARGSSMTKRESIHVGGLCGRSARRTTQLPALKWAYPRRLSYSFFTTMKESSHRRPIGAGHQNSGSGQDSRRSGIRTMQ